MTKRAYKRRHDHVVVDASVAQAAGVTREPVVPEREACTGFLRAVEAGDLRVVMTPEIFEEWTDHPSGFALRWLTRMTGRKRVTQHSPAAVAPVDRQTILGHCVSDKQKRAAEKDFLLLAAATGPPAAFVASKDDRMRDILRLSCGRCGPLDAVDWVNPTRGDEVWEDWLAERCPCGTRALCPDGSRRREVVTLPLL